MNTNVQIQQQGHVFSLIFNEGEYNYMTISLLERISDELEKLEKNDACRCILLRSEGKVFCAGASLKASGDNEALPDSDSNPIYYQAVRMFRISKPIIAVIQGSAVGGGLGIALVADFRVASPKARFAANFVSLGIHAGFGISYTLPQLIGNQNAALMLLTGRRIKADVAKEMGLVDILTSEENLLTDAMQLATEIANQAPLAVEATRKTLRKNLAKKIKEQTDYEWKLQQALMQTEDFKEGVLAVRDRRNGNFNRR